MVNNVHTISRGVGDNQSLYSLIDFLKPHDFTIYIYSPHQVKVQLEELTDVKININRTNVMSLL